MGIEQTIVDQQVWISFMDLGFVLLVKYRCFGVWQLYSGKLARRSVLGPSPAPWNVFPPELQWLPRREARTSCCGSLLEIVFCMVHLSLQSFRYGGTVSIAVPSRPFRLL